MMILKHKKGRVNVVNNFQSMHVLMYGLSGVFSAWNERGWIVKHQGNLKIDYRFFVSVYF